MATGLFNLKQVNQAISQGAWSGYIAPKWVEYLVVAGGGGGASGYGNLGGGGGGAGGLLTGIVTVTTGTSYTVTVGSGGAGSASSSGATGTSGSSSVFGSISATGGGASKSDGAASAAYSGGSGGGATWSGVSAGSGTSGQGNAGGASTTSSPAYAGGGGGGAGTVGLNATSASGGNGGAGIASAISGTVTTYAGGGGAGSVSGFTSGGVGGGGAGNSSYPASGSAGGGNNGGGGGGGAGNGYTGGSGGSGIVVVRYPGQVQFFTGGTLSYANGYIIHTFYSSGTLAPTTPTLYIDPSYQISRSLRFNSADSAYLNRTPASATNRTTWTWSGWVKRSSFGTDQQLFSAGGSGAFQFLYQTSTDCLYIYDSVSSTTAVITTQVFRDPSAWYHVVLATDTTQATASNRFKLYINGVQVTSFGTATYPAQNSTLSVNNTVNHSVGSWSGAGGGNFFSGYMTEVNFIDGQALTPSSFGSYSTTTGVWTPTKFVGTYGTNGFYLNFSDNSNTTAATLGKDYSGNGNNWTPNNFSVTAGAGNDSLVDSPTSYGTDTGVGGEVRGNYCTWNPLKNPQVAVLTNGNLDLSTAGSTARYGTYTTIGVTTGKWYWEITAGSLSTDGYNIGIVNASKPDTTALNADTNSYIYLDTGQKGYNGAGSAYGATYTAGDVIGVALDLDAGTLVFYKNGTSQGTAFTSIASNTWFPTVADNATGSTTGSSFIANFGQRPFAYTAPSGYKALCTQNLPTPTIGATTATQAGKYFNTILYTGTGTTQSVTGVGFQPDFVWLKDRTTAYDNALFDSVRGASGGYYYKLRSNRTDSETALSQGQYGAVKTIDSDGYTLGSSDTVFGQSNASGDNYVAWNWKANGSGSTNTAGQITSTVSANTTSGFSVVTFTTDGTTKTVGHGLGVKPSLIIAKVRNGVGSWIVMTDIINGSMQYATLNSTAAFASIAYSAPTSTVFQYNDNNGNTQVAYCFASIEGYSKIGTYTGNGSTDGPFIYTGMRPAYFLARNVTDGGNWNLYDATRGPYNVDTPMLIPNSSATEYTGGIDLLSNGVKIRTDDSPAGSNVNQSGKTYIFMAFASNPFKYSLAR